MRKINKNKKLITVVIIAMFITLAYIKNDSVKNKTKNSIEEFDKRSTEDRIIMVQMFSDTEVKYGVKDSKGNIIVDYKYDNLSDYKNGYSIFENKENATVGIIDKEGNEVISKSTKEIKTIHSVSKDKVLIVRRPNDKVAYMNISGEVTMELDYSFVTEMYNGYAMAYKSKENESSLSIEESNKSVSHIIDENGEEVKEVKGQVFEYLKNGVYIFFRDLKGYSVSEYRYALVNYNGETIIDGISDYNRAGEGNMIISENDTVTVEVGKDKGQARWITINLDGTEVK